MHWDYSDSLYGNLLIEMGRDSIQTRFEEKKYAQIAKEVFGIENSASGSVTVREKSYNDSFMSMSSDSGKHAQSLEMPLLGDAIVDVIVDQISYAWKKSGKPTLAHWLLNCANGVWITYKQAQQTRNMRRYKKRIKLSVAKNWNSVPR